METNFVLNTLFTLSILNVSDGMNTLQKPIVGIEMTESGMHRDLLFTVQFDYPLAGKECDYILEQNLPAAVYVSVDQLDDLKRLKKIDALYPKFIDVEVTTEKAEPFKLLLKGMPKITASFKLPIHYRYHAPSQNKKFVHVEIEPPKMYLNCPPSESNLIEPELQLIPNSNFCLDEENLVFRSPVEEDDYGSESCQWNPINFELQVKSSLVAKIPVGNTEGYPPILIATIIVSWIVSLYTVFRTQSVPYRINRQLHEQRFLQNKSK